METKNYDWYFEQYITPIQVAVGTRNRKNVNCFERVLIQNETTELDPGLILGLEENVISFYRAIQEWKVKWKTQPELPYVLDGSFNFISIEQMAEISDTPFMPNDFPNMRGFRLLDYFYNEGAVGFYINQPERGLFLFLFDADPQPLQIGFEGYLDLLVYTRGVSYWQNLILEHLTKQSYANVSKIREHLPKLFPDFSMEGFIERYEARRLT